MYITQIKMKLKCILLLLQLHGFEKNYWLPNQLDVTVLGSLLGPNELNLCKNPKHNVKLFTACVCCFLLPVFNKPYVQLQDLYSINTQTNEIHIKLLSQSQVDPCVTIQFRRKCVWHHAQASTTEAHSEKHVIITMMLMRLFAPFLLQNWNAWFLKYAETYTNKTLAL